MPDLPKRGDRVRVTEAHEHSLLSPGDEITLTSDAYECGGRQAFGDAPPDAVAFMFESSVDGECGSHAVKVEILERAGTRALREAKESIERLATTSVYQAKQDAAAEFARGMRRAVEIAEGLPFPLSYRYLLLELSEAVETDLLKAIDEARK